MKILIQWILLVCLLFAGSSLTAQIGESKYKKVTLGPNGNKVNQYYAALKIKQLIYTDGNSDLQLESNENGSISWYIKNTGTVQLRELIVNVKLTNNTTGIEFIRNQSLSTLKAGDSVLVKIPLKADDTIKTGLANFEINVGDAQSDCRKKTQLEIKTKGKL